MRLGKRSRRHGAISGLVFVVFFGDGDTYVRMYDKRVEGGQIFFASQAGVFVLC